MKSVLQLSLIVMLFSAGAVAHAQELSEGRDGLSYMREYRLDLRGVKDVRFDDMGGSIELSRIQGEQLLVVQVIPVGNRSEPDAMTWGGGFELALSVSGSHARVEGAGDPRGTSYEIRIPSGIDVELESDWGEIEASGLTGNLDIEHGGGSVEVERLEGSLAIRSDGGDVQVEDVAGSVAIISDGGSVDIARVGQDVKVATGGGGLDVHDVDGNVSATTAAGNVDVSNVKGHVRAVTSAGNMVIEEVAGDADLSNGGGSIDVWNIGGSLSATTSGGDVAVTGIRGEVRVETQAGDIELTEVGNSVRVISEVGDVEIEVSDARFLDHGRMDIDLGHGDIDLVLPRSTNARLIANVQESGGIDITSEGWEVEVVRNRGQTDGNRSRRAEIRIGKGGGDIQIRLLSGEITVNTPW